MKKGGRHNDQIACTVANEFKRLGGKRGAGVRGTGYGVWKTRGVENAGSGGKRGVW